MSNVDYTFLFLINQLARHPVSEEFIAQRCNLITCSKHIAQIIASHERSELDSRHARRQLKCSGKPSAVAEYPLTDGLEVMWQFDLQEILLCAKVKSGIVVAFVLEISRDTRFGI